MKSSENKQDKKYYTLDDDDQAVLDLTKSDELNDDETIIEAYENSGLIDQGQQAITYAVQDLYKNKKMTKYRSSLSMQARSPKLTIETSDGNGFSINLTEKLNRHLKTLLTDVDDAYMGKPKGQQHVKLNEWRLGDGAFDKFVKYLKTCYPLILLSLVWLLAGILYGVNFKFGAIILSVVGVVMALKPKNKDKGDSKDE